MDRQGRVPVVQPYDHSDTHHVRPQRIDEGPTELPVLGCRSQRPSHRMDDTIQRRANLPHFLDTELPDLRCSAAHLEMVQADTTEVPLTALRQDCRAGHDVTAR